MRWITQRLKYPPPPSHLLNRTTFRLSSAGGITPGHQTSDPLIIAVGRLDLIGRPLLSRRASSLWRRPCLKPHSDFWMSPDVGRNELGLKSWFGGAVHAIVLRSYAFSVDNALVKTSTYIKSERKRLPHPPLGPYPARFSAEARQQHRFHSLYGSLWSSRLGTTKPSNLFRVYFFKSLSSNLGSKRVGGLFAGLIRPFDRPI